MGLRVGKLLSSGSERKKVLCTLVKIFFVNLRLLQNNFLKEKESINKLGFSQMNKLSWWDMTPSGCTIPVMELCRRGSLVFLEMKRGWSGGARPRANLHPVSTAISRWPYLKTGSEDRLSAPGEQSYLPGAGAISRFLETGEQDANLMIYCEKCNQGHRHSLSSRFPPCSKLQGKSNQESAWQTSNAARRAGQCGQSSRGIWRRAGWFLHPAGEPHTWQWDVEAWVWVRACPPLGGAGVASQSPIFVCFHGWPPLYFWLMCSFFRYGNSLSHVMNSWMSLYVCDSVLTPSGSILDVHSEAYTTLFEFPSDPPCHY